MHVMNVILLQVGTAPMILPIHLDNTHMKEIPSQGHVHGSYEDLKLRTNVERIGVIDTSMVLK
jgi:hypothetical protein